jgi:hypothetical protein
MLQAMIRKVNFGVHPEGQIARIRSHGPSVSAVRNASTSAAALSAVADRTVSHSLVS